MKPPSPRPPGAQASGRPQSSRGPRPEGGPGFRPKHGHHHGPRPAPPPRGTPDAPRGTVWLYGLHAVAAALANPARRLRRLVLTEEAETALAARLPKPWALAPERAERARLDQFSAATSRTRARPCLPIRLRRRRSRRCWSAPGRCWCSTR